MLYVEKPLEPGCMACCSGEPFPTELQRDVTAVSL